MADFADRIRIKFVRAYSSKWIADNPVLELGEPGFERDTGKLKIGDGATPWRTLPYFVGSVGTGGEISRTEFEAHVSSMNPHPAYDDGHSFVLLYENAKV